MSIVWNVTISRFGRIITLNDTLNIFRIGHSFIFWRVSKVWSIGKMSKITKMCCVCRLDTPDLIDLRYKDEAMHIFNKLKEFIDLNVSKIHVFLFRPLGMCRKITGESFSYDLNNICLTISLNVRNFCELSFVAIWCALFYFRDISQAMEYDPKIKFICLPCHDTLDVVYDFKQKCDKSMAISRLKMAKLVFKCKTCPMAFETAHELEKHIVTHSIDLTEDDQPDVAPPKRAGPKNGKSKSKPPLILGGLKMRFKIPMRSSKKQSDTPKKGKNSPKKKTNQKSTSKSQHGSAFQHPSAELKCPACKREFQNRAGLHSHIKLAKH